MKPLDEYPHVQPDRCSLCGQDVVWVQGASGVCIPVDSAPVPNGELTIIAGRVQPPINELLGLILGPSECRYTQHLRTCGEMRTPEAKRERIDAMAKAPHPHQVQQCQCGASFFHAPSGKGNGKHIPLCERPDPTGNIFLNEQHEAVYVSAANPAPAGATLYKSHFADCPQASQFRSKK